MIDEDKDLYRFLTLPVQLDLKSIPSFEPILQKKESTLWEKVKTFFNTTLPPLFFLPADPLNRLIGLTQEELKELCRYLGHYDLANEIPRLVETRLIKKLHLALKPQECPHLDDCLLNGNLAPLPSLNLGAWDGEKDSLNKALFDRGKFRLQSALSGSYFLLFNHLPTEFQPIKKGLSNEILEVLRMQVIKTYEFLKKVS